MFDVSTPASCANASISSLELVMAGWMETVVETTSLLALVFSPLVGGLTSESSRILSRCFLSAVPMTTWRMSLFS